MVHDDASTPPAFDKPHKVIFDLGGILTWDFFDDNELDQLRADPTGTGVGLLTREVQSHSRGQVLGGYDGPTLMLSSVRDIFIELPTATKGPNGQILEVNAEAMRAHVESGSTAGGAYGELCPNLLSQTREQCVMVFAPESIVIAPMPAYRPVEFSRAARGEEDEATLRPSRRIELRDLPPEPPRDPDCIIIVEPCS